MELNLMFSLLIGALVVSIIYTSFLYKRGKKEQIFLIVKALVDEAEIKFGSGKGKLKYEFVVENVYRILPLYAKMFISDSLLDRFIETAVNELQEYLEKKIKK